MLGDAELPALHRSADKSSLEAQTLYRRATAGTLVALLFAAICGALSLKWGPGSVDWAGVGAAVAFMAVLVVQSGLARSRPERAWYDGRALAESAKSLGWQYAVAGGAYGLGAVPEPGDADRKLVGDLGGLLDDLPEGQPAPAEEPQISRAMRSLRDSSLERRRSAYLDNRVRDQRSWYAGKATWNKGRRRLWFAAVVLLQVGGGSGAVLKAAGVVEIDVLGIASAAAASIVAWTQLNDHGQLEEAYSLASHELSMVESTIGDAVTEDGWADYVADAEQAISREHRMWRAARSH